MQPPSGTNASSNGLFSLSVFTPPLPEKEVAPGRRLVFMTALINTIETALCWTVLAPLARMNRQRRAARLERDAHDRARVSALLTAIVTRHADLLA